MGSSSKRLVGAAFAAGGIAAMAWAGGGGPVGAGNRDSFHGVFSETAAGSTAGYDIHGSAKMTISAGGTVAKINVSGLHPNAVYSSHLHVGTCAEGNPGAGHYKHDKDGAGAPPNELWFNLVVDVSVLATNGGGVAHGSGSATWQARVSTEKTNARSVIIHAPDNGKIACAGLR